MARETSTSRPAPIGWRVAAGFFLVLEALWWAVNAGPVFTVGFGQSVTAELLSIPAVVLVFLTFLAVFLLFQIPRWGVWLGLVLQGIIGIHAFFLIFGLTSLLGAFELALGVCTALCLFRRHD
jgi:hypothetical protein